MYMYMHKWNWFSPLCTSDKCCPQTTAKLGPNRTSNYLVHQLHELSLCKWNRIILFCTKFLEEIEHVGYSHPICTVLSINLDIRQFLVMHQFKLHKCVWTNRPANTTLNGSFLCKKRSITKETVDNWIVENNKALNMMTWLQYDRKDCEYVVSLECSVCIPYQNQLHGVQNYNPAFISGSTNLQMSCFKHHAWSSEQWRFQKESMQSMQRCLTHSTLVQCSV